MLNTISRERTKKSSEFTHNPTHTLLHVLSTRHVQPGEQPPLFGPPGTQPPIGVTQLTFAKAVGALMLVINGSSTAATPKRLTTARLERSVGS